MFNKKMSKDDFIRELNCFFKTNIIDEKTNFLEIGISSLQIMRLINNLSKSGVKVAFGELMEKRFFCFFHKEKINTQKLYIVILKLRSILI